MKGLSPHSGSSQTIFFCCISVIFLLSVPLAAEDPTKRLSWHVGYAVASPLGMKQRVITINGQFPGPHIDAEINDSVKITVFNGLSEPFLVSWNVLQTGRNSRQDGVHDTACPIPPGENYTYLLQIKDQIGSSFYYPSLALHRAAGGFGGIRIQSGPEVPVPFPPPSADFTLLAGDWFKADHASLKAALDSGKNLPFPDGLLINGRGWNGCSFTVHRGNTYRFRISNVGLTQSINIRFQGHKMKLVEAEGSHTRQNTYSSLDVHLGQSYSVLVTADQPVRDYYIVVSSRFTSPVLTTTAVLHYSGSSTAVKGVPPGGPTFQVDYSLFQARSIRLNLTASGARPAPQGAYKYGTMKANMTIRLANSAPHVNGRQRYAVNGVSLDPNDPRFEMAYSIRMPDMFMHRNIPDDPFLPGGLFKTSIVAASFRDFAEIVFENKESTVQSWHIDGYTFFVVGMDGGTWSSASRKGYNLRDAVARSTVQVYPSSWTAIYLSLDHVGMWNIRSENWVRQYLGQQLYLRVYPAVNFWWNIYPIPQDVLDCLHSYGPHSIPF